MSGDGLNAQPRSSGDQSPASVQYARKVQRFLMAFAVISQSTIVLTQVIIPYKCIKFLFFGSESTCQTIVFVWVLAVLICYSFCITFSLIRVIMVARRRETAIPRLLDHANKLVFRIILLLFFFGLIEEFSADSQSTCSTSYSALYSIETWMAITMILPCLVVMSLCCYVPMILCVLGLPPSDARAPASEAAINQLRKTKFSESSKGVSDCSICLSKFEGNSIVITLPCNSNHIFHADCIEPWLRMFHGTCPLCREPVDPQEAQIGNPYQRLVEEDIENLQRNDQQEAQYMRRPLDRQFI